jgi:NADH:ubiquinone oxidoreductase subunit F (NADH-binding)
MPAAPRVLPAEPVPDLGSYLAAGGGRAIDAARRVPPAVLVDEVDAAGLRGRGGGGFPTGRKWRTIAENQQGTVPATVVVNGAEGEPGSFKDRALMRADPFRVLEGAILAARAVGADTVVLALKRTFTDELVRLRDAVEQAAHAGWCDGLALDVFPGPPAYLFGEETGLLEALDGRPPFPRVTPPYRRGFDEVADPEAGDSSSAAQVELAGPTDETIGPPSLVDNVETLANVPGIVAEGAAWYREVGTRTSPGTVVCTVSGDAPEHGVAEFPMGTRLRDVLARVGRVDPDRVRAVMIGVSNALLGPADLDVALTYEDLAAAGSGLGTAGFIVVDEATDLAAVVAGAARFLAVESCGQCTPCKQDGREIAEHLAALLDDDPGTDGDATIVADRLRTVADGARCNLASQQQSVVGSLLARFPGELEPGRAGAPTEPFLVAGIRDLVDGRFVLDEHEQFKQPDWTFGSRDSGQAPADRLVDRREARAT